MEARAAPDDDDRDWRLSGEIEGAAAHGVLHAFVERMREEPALEEARAKLGEEVVVTHDGSRLFAYAYGRAAIERARTEIETALLADGLRAELALSHFAPDVDEWVDPDAPAPAAADPAAAGQPASRTVVALVGRMIRDEFEQSLRTWADQLGLRCEIVEHPHLLSTQVAFTVTGPARKLDEFAAGLDAEERRTIRTERAVMLSPL